MKNEVQNFEEILPESVLLDSEMEALRGGEEHVNIACGVGFIARCDIGKVLPNDNCKVSCCSPREKSEFSLFLQKKFHIGKLNNIPKLQTGRCSATAEHSYIIDPEGNLYKCWNDIGIEDYCIGNVKDGLKNNSLIANYIIGSDKYSDPECLKCKLFPICDGGCNKQRMDNVESGKHSVLCPFDETGVCDRLYDYYKTIKNAK